MNNNILLTYIDKPKTTRVLNRPLIGAKFKSFFLFNAIFIQ